ncbi:MAG TPA: DUF5916 domain-containing protein, partial [Gemmatimonadaceae bacterium]|nr:DUF5916 domain-containing protein [Gemmatimonadaceae bacterium]
GRLDDPLWATVPRVSGFVQSEPDEGKPATEDTEVMVAFDADNLYVAAFLHDREPGRLVVNDIRKDFKEEDQDDFEVILDTFGDRRNGYVFITNAEGARADRQMANEGRETNASWDAIWTVRTQRRADGWTVEMAIPFRALRFEQRDVSTWGINFARRIRRKNEITYWSPVPRQYNINRVSAAGTLEGLHTTGAGRDLRVKPYVSARSVRDLDVGARFHDQMDGGVDVKLGLTQSLTLDGTVNPDFAQAEADEQQVNLSQFSQFFPEKREFFLESSGIFYVGDAARNRQNPSPTPDEDLLLFFSRRIGLDDDNRAIPISGGARLTGKVGGLAVGALSLQTHQAAGLPANHYSVIRARRNLLAGSDVGLVFLNRQGTGEELPGVARYNRVYGGDVNLRLFGDWDWNNYYVRSATPAVARGQYAYRTTMNHEGTFFHVKAGVMELGEGFRDDLGYYRRTDVRKYILDTGLRPRPAWWAAHGTRELHPHVTWDYYEDLSGRVVGKRLHTAWTFFFNSGGLTELSFNPRYEYLESAFAVFTQPARDSVVIPSGGWAWNEYMLKLQTDGSRMLSLSMDAIAGGLWSGSQRTVRSTVNFKPSYHLRLSGGVQLTKADMSRGHATDRTRFTATLYTVRAGYSFTTNMFLDALTQFDPAQRQMDANVRFNLIHHALSDLFVVYNESRITRFDAGMDRMPAGRSLIVKATQMLAF